MKEYITKRVHELYWKEDINCARTALVCLSELFEIAIEPQKDAFVFIRACEPTAIEYTVAVAEERIEEKDICRIDFGM